jgi:hypothetical protein
LIAYGLFSKRERERERERERKKFVLFIIDITPAFH